mgnify:CR=1 FL=1
MTLTYEAIAHAVHEKAMAMAMAMANTQWC